MTETGYVLVADVLGFSGMISNTALPSMEQRITEWVEFVRSASTQQGVSRYQLLSDTVFAAVPGTSEDLRRLVALARTLVQEGLRRSFPIRGGIAFGEFSWGQLTYGPAVIAAHRLESQQQWIGIACMPGLQDAATLWDSKELVCYLPPMKSGHAQAHPVVNWDVPNAERLTAFVMQANSVRDGGFLDWEIMTKMQNTLDFGSYLLILEAEKLHASRFYGPLPGQLVNEVIRKRAYKTG